MQTILIGVILVLHGLVHLLYFGQSRKAFELRPGLAWPDGSLAFSKLLGDERARQAAGVALIVAALGFVTGGISLMIGQPWWRLVAIGSAVFSSTIFILFWDGKIQALDARGGVGVLINLVILVGGIVLVP